MREEKTNCVCVENTHMFVLCKRKVNYLYFFFSLLIFFKKRKKKIITRRKRQCLHLVCLYFFFSIHFFYFLLLVSFGSKRSRGMVSSGAAFLFTFWILRFCFKDSKKIKICLDSYLKILRIYPKTKKH